ncbi:MAG: methanogenesis marker 6 protein [Methanosphaera sp.]|nr:methanogenesis marker 6 protein [Methanosphaera sp.]
MMDGTYHDSDQEGKINRMIVLGPGSSVSSKELFNFLHVLELPLNIRITCYGANVNGLPYDVNFATSQARALDPTHIFIKIRGFPPGDPRRCRAKRGGAREGFHQLEAEYKLLPDVTYALEHPKHVSLENPKKIPLDEFIEIVEEQQDK